MNSVFSVKQLIRIYAIIALTHFLISQVEGQTVEYHDDEELNDEDLEGIHPKADWKDVISETADTLWCDVRLRAKSLWCAGTSAYDWLQMSVTQTDRRWCCYMYDTNRCIATAAKQLCSNKEFDKMATILKAKNERLMSGRCQAYGYQWYDWKSWKCHLPIIPICVTLIALIVTIKIMYKLSPSDVRFWPRFGQTGRRSARTTT